MSKDKIVDEIFDDLCAFWGCDPMYDNVDGWALAFYLYDRGYSKQTEEVKTDV